MIELTDVTLPEDIPRPIHAEPFSDWRSDILTRLAKLEQNREPWPTHGLTSGSSTSSPTARSEPESLSSRSFNRQSFLLPTSHRCKPDQVEQAFQGGTNLVQPIAALDRILGPETEQNGMSSAPNHPNARYSFMDCGEYPDCCKADLQMWDAKNRPRDVEHLRATLHDFFNHLNPHCRSAVSRVDTWRLTTLDPCLNESQFMLQFESYLAGHETWSKPVESLQFVALINLIAALMKILGEYCTDSNTIPGGPEFSRAEHLLGHASWLGRGNLMTIQCAVIKSTYLLYAEKQNAAYDTIGAAVRICFQIGLHDQARWQALSPFDITMRQRIFWSVYCLDRNVAMVCGVPYLVRESDFRVDWPLCLDDRRLSPELAFPEETRDFSPIPYLRGTAKWGKLCSEMWDSMFATSAQKPVSQEFIATMDARIVLLSSELPPWLQFRGYNRSFSKQLPDYVQRQSSILYLVSHVSTRSEFG